MNVDLTGGVALVTGGSGGIGAAVTRSLVEAGASVATAYANDACAADSLRAELGDACSAWQADVCDERAAAALVADVVERHGSLDVLVLNTGVWRAGRIERISAKDWHEVVETSLGGAYHVCRAAVPVMRERGFGRIVAVSSVVGLIGFVGDTAYAATKAGLFGFVRALANEVASAGITVTTLPPGVIDAGTSTANRRIRGATSSPAPRSGESGRPRKWPARCASSSSTAPRLRGTSSWSTEG